MHLLGAAECVVTSCVFVIDIITILYRYIASKQYISQMQKHVSAS
jgi:hypothetical protein